MVSFKHFQEGLNPLRRDKIMLCLWNLGYQYPKGLDSFELGRRMATLLHRLQQLFDPPIDNNSIRDGIDSARQLVDHRRRAFSQIMMGTIQKLEQLLQASKIHKLLAIICIIRDQELESFNRIN